MASKKKKQGFTEHSLLTYAPLGVIESALHFHADSIKAYAYIKHDRDVKDDGSPDVPHYHVLVRLWTRKSLSAVRRWFWCLDENGPVNTFDEPMEPALAFAYLTHQYEPDKYQYPESSVVCSDRKWFVFDDFVYADSLTIAYQMALVGVNPYNIAMRFGRDFIIHQSDVYALRDRTIEYARVSPRNKIAVEDTIFSICNDLELKL